MHNPPTHKGRTVMRISALTQARLINLLIDGMLSCEELAAETGLHLLTVQKYTAALRREGACYIDHWEKDVLGRDSIRIYKIGRAPDKARAKMTGAARAKRHREKLRHLDMMHRMAA